MHSEEVKKWFGLKVKIVNIVDRCDLCQGYGESACVQACPKKAIERVDVEEFSKEKLRKYIDRVTVLALRS